MTLRANLLHFVETRKSVSSFPSDADLQGMAVSLNRIQSIYSLDVRDLTKVRISTEFQFRYYLKLKAVSNHRALFEVVQRQRSLAGKSSYFWRKIGWKGGSNLGSACLRSMHWRWNGWKWHMSK